MEQAALDQFIQHKLQNFMGRGELLDHLTELALSLVEGDTDWGACVTGGPGQWQKRHLRRTVPQADRRSAGGYAGAGIRSGACHAFF